MEYSYFTEGREAAAVPGEGLCPARDHPARGAALPGTLARAVQGRQGQDIQEERTEVK